MKYILLLTFCACAHGPVANKDHTLTLLERAMTEVRAGNLDDGRALLAEAHDSFDDLSEAGIPLFGKESDKAYRPHPHERVFVSSLLATLDANAGHCDLAIPAAKDALRWSAYWHERTSKEQLPNAIWPAFIGLSCARRLHRPASETHFTRELETAARINALDGFVPGSAEGQLRVSYAKTQVRHLLKLANEDVTLILNGQGPQAQSSGVNLAWRPAEVSSSCDDALVLGACTDDQAAMLLWSSSNAQKHTRLRNYTGVLVMRSALQFGMNLAAVRIGGNGESALRKTASHISTDPDARYISGLFGEVWLAMADSGDNAPFGDSRGRTLAP